MKKVTKTVCELRKLEFKTNYGPKTLKISDCERQQFMGYMSIIMFKKIIAEIRLRIATGLHTGAMFH